MGQSAVTWVKRFGADTILEMNMLHNRMHWPLLTYFLFKEKVNGLTKLTMKDFRNDEFNTTYTQGYLLDLTRCAIPILIKHESLYERNAYSLSPFGKWQARHIWESLNYLTKKFKGPAGCSIQEYVDSIIKTRTLEPEMGAVDIEEEAIKKIEEDNARKAAARAGVVNTQNGAKIDLNKIEVGEQHVNASN